LSLKLKNCQTQDPCSPKAGGPTSAISETGRAVF